MQVLIEFTDSDADLNELMHELASVPGVQNLDLHYPSDRNIHTKSASAAIGVLVGLLPNMVDGTFKALSDFLARSRAAPTTIEVELDAARKLKLSFDPKQVSPAEIVPIINRVLDMLSASAA